ncbi:ribosome assembly RNA-binding protein YhbY [Pseudolysobacter antarcticus]|uniref:Ribosome assembly RNA-binding protein YhbY n=1 Tax=Pseudolysobacter antarcticus TaxID=2511995 RepID=A0A411HLE5_9GAMM|nr:ribosome assembly RNA-binding protein YhbY [Pseudolysobacter antarcticus]QBB71352.1 ribosome assembly RNA-binding protein YhbY [Pseudolysobacter antarcticus]
MSVTQSARKGISNTQRRYLRGLAHQLKPVIMVGNKGITESLLKEFDSALARHELVKVKLSSEDRDERKSQIAAMADSGQAEVVQSVGRVALYFRRNSEEPVLALPN